jgi:hypothetical protein
MPRNGCFLKVGQNELNFKRCENDPKSIKTMGYSPCFLVKNAPKWMFLKNELNFKRCENDPKAIKTMGYSPFIV